MFETLLKPGSQQYLGGDRRGGRDRPWWRSQRRGDDFPDLRKRAPVKVRISGPRYYVYRPDAPKSFSLAELAKMPEATEARAGSSEKIVAKAEIAEEREGKGPVVSDARLVEPPEVIAFNAARGHLAGVSMRMLPEVAKAVLEHYRRSPRFIWVTNGRVNERAEAARAVFADADDIGLVSAEYFVELPPAIPSPGTANPVTSASSEEGDGFSVVERRQRALIVFEMAMSAKALTYVLDATRGRIDPNRISGYHDLPRKKVDLGKALQEIAESYDVITYLLSKSPSGEHFRRLVEELARLKLADEGERVEIAPGTLIKPGRPNPELANVVRAIRLRGSEALKSRHAATLEAYDGGPDYTPELIELVRDFQREAKLKPDGVVGRNTIRALVGETNAAKIAKLRLAMERARWLPGELGERYVFVNQPAFTATYRSPDAKPLSMRVVVGKKSNQTSFFTDKLETVEYNPYWGVPLSIIVNEMMPKLNKDPAYLDRIGYEVTTASGKRVSSSSVDWQAVATRAQTINVRQLPGRRNALGQLKILFPNKHAIYMHDTPAKSLFKRDRRAFSHGCIRLQDPRAMAAAVLGKSKDYVAARIAQGKNDKDPVRLDIPIYVAYFTAWPNPDGRVEYFDDVYDRDVYLSRAMAATAKVRRAEG